MREIDFLTRLETEIHFIKLDPVAGLSEQFLKLPSKNWNRENLKE